MTSTPTKDRQEEKRDLTPASKHQGEPSSKRLHVETQEQEQDTGI